MHLARSDRAPSLVRLHDNWITDERRLEYIDLYSLLETE